MNYKQYDIIIGIDPGVNTGVAIWKVKQKKLLECYSCQLMRATAAVKKAFDENRNLLVRVEDARLRNWFGKSGREKLQGAGSIKRDCGLWEEFLTANEIPFELVPPKKNKTKMDAVTFTNYTKWIKRTNNHARDAAWLVFGL